MSISSSACGTRGGRWNHSARCLTRTCAPFHASGDVNTHIRARKHPRHAPESTMKLGRIKRGTRGCIGGARGLQRAGCDRLRAGAAPRRMTGGGQQKKNTSGWVAWWVGGWLAGWLWLYLNEFAGSGSHSARHGISSIPSFFDGICICLDRKSYFSQSHLLPVQFTDDSRCRAHLQALLLETEALDLVEVQPRLLRPAWQARTKAHISGPLSPCHGLRAALEFSCSYARTAWREKGFTGARACVRERGSCRWSARAARGRHHVDTVVCSGSH